MPAHTITWRNVKHMEGDNVLDIFTRAGFTFPQDYLACAIKNNGGRPDQNIMVVNGIETEFRGLLRIDAGGEGNIQEAYDIICDDFPDCIPFGDDSYGNFICFCWTDRSKTPGVCFLDKAQQAMLPLAAGFTGFLRMLQSEEELLFRPVNDLFQKDTA